MEPLKVLKSSQVADRRALVERLGRDKSVEATAVLVAALGDRDARVRWWALDGLESRTEVPEGTVAIVKALLDDRDVGVRTRARPVLTQLDPPRGLLALLWALRREPVAWSRELAAKDLGRAWHRHLGPDSLKVPGRVWPRDDEDVKVALANVLLAVDDRDPDVRIAVMELVTGIDVKVGGMVAASLLRDKDPKVRERAVRILVDRVRIPRSDTPLPAP
jgi:HEAT repeat protein